MSCVSGRCSCGNFESGSSVGSACSNCGCVRPITFDEYLPRDYQMLTVEDIQALAEWARTYRKTRAIKNARTLIGWAKYLEDALEGLDD